jgi:hypothetical protein
MAISTPAQPTKLHEEQPLAQYRSVAPLAVVAAVLGVASALILTTPLLAPLPVAGIVVGIAALRSIGASRGQLAGRSVAIAGLCLATFFLGFGLSRHLGRQAELEKVARGMADVFLNLLQDGKPREAHQFRLTPSSRITAPEAIAEHYEKNTEAASELQTFVASGVIKDLIARGKEADVRFEGVSSATRDGKTDMLVLRYSCASIEPAGSRQSLWLHINRKYDESTKRHEWEIGGISNTPPVGSGE